MNWNRKLSQMLILEDKTKLTTLRDAAGALDRYFSTVKDSKMLEGTIARLMTAAEPSKRADVVAATESVLRELGHRHVLKRNERHAGAQGAAGGYAPANG